MAFECVPEFFPRIAAIGEHMAQPREAETDGLENFGCAVAVLNISGMDEDEDQKSAGVGDDVALATLDLLARVIARDPATFRCFDRLAVNDASRWTGFPASLLARRHHQQVIDRRQQATVP